jgi:hypothetical protein
MANESFNFSAFIQESKDCLLKPREHFASLKISGGLAEPVIKALIYGAVAGIISFLFSILHLGAAGGGMFGGAFGIMILIWSVIGAVIGLFIGAVVMLIISAICKGSTDFEANARVVSSFMVLMPVRAAFGFLYSINITLALIVASLISVYGIYLLFHALTQTLKANEGTSKIVSYVLVGLMVILMITGMMAKRVTSGFMNKLDENGEYSKELKKYQEEMEKSAKEYEQAAQEASEDLEENTEEVGDTPTQ